MEVLSRDPPYKNGMSDSQWYPLRYHKFFFLKKLKKKIIKFLREKSKIPDQKTAVHAEILVCGEEGTIINHKCHSINGVHMKLRQTDPLISFFIGHGVCLCRIYSP